jgi:hypothetical protein
MTEQNYANHSRYDWRFHFFAIPVMVANVIVHLGWLYRRPNFETAWGVLVSIALLTLSFLLRIYALRDQDRIIRLEETLRFARLLPPDLQARIPELHMKQYTALRFCPDDELADVARAVFNGELKDPKEIKQRVKNWRADYHRC